MVFFDDAKSSFCVHTGCHWEILLKSLVDGLKFFCYCLDISASCRNGFKIGTKRKLFQLLHDAVVPMANDVKFLLVLFWVFDTAVQCSVRNSMRSVPTRDYDV